MTELFPLPSLVFLAGQLDTVCTEPFIYHYVHNSVLPQNWLIDNIMHIQLVDVCTQSSLGY